VIEPSAGPAITLARKNSEWRMTTPVDARADFSPVDGLVGRVAQAQMKGIEVEGTEPTPAQLKTFGLDKPQLRVTIGAGSSRATLAIGAKKNDATLYARDLSRPLVFTVESSLLTDLEKKPDDLRAKDIFTTQSYNATGLDIAHAGTSFSFAKSAGAPAADASASPTDVWKQTKPNAKDVNATAMTDLINTIASLHAEKFEAKPPSGGDEMTVTLESGDAAKPTEEQVTLRKVGETAYAVHAGDTGAAVVPAADFDKAVEQLKALTTSK
jgi:hypothetical protein